MKKWLKILGRIVLVLLIIVVINFIPTFFKQESGMSTKDNEYFTFYYNESDKGADDVYHLALSEAPRIIEDLRLHDTNKIKIYLYDDQKLMQSKSLGFIAYFLDLPWFIGGATTTELVMVSPATPNTLYDYDEILQTILHEVGHTYNYQLNPNMDLWIDEGMAILLAGQRDGITPSDVIGMPIPSFQESKTENAFTFSEIHGHFYARLYADYLIEEYGYDAWLQLLETNDYESVYGKSHENIYNEFVDYLKSAQ